MLVRSPVALALLTGLLCISLTAPASAVPVSVDVSFLGPSKLDFPAYESIGISHVRGWRAAEMESSLIKALLDKDRGASAGSLGAIVHAPNAFPVVERSQLELVMAEVSLGSGGLTDEATRAKLGELMGAGILLTGTLADPQHRDNFTSSKKTKEDRDGNKHTYTEYCATRAVSVKFDIRVINSSTGVILASETVGGNASEKKCDRSQRAVENSLTDPDTMAAGFITGMAYRAANQIAPYWRSMNFKLERNKTTKDGVKLVKKQADRVGAAIFFTEAAAADPYDEWLQYSASVLLAINYHLDDAVEYLKKARAINDRPRFKKYAGKLELLIAWRDGLQRMGLNIDPLNLAPETGGSAPGGTDTVVVMGGRNKRVPLTSEAGGGSTVVQVPGKMTLTVLERSGSYVKVETFDGKVGWVEAKAVK